MRNYLKRILILIILWFSATVSFAQFYNGMQMTFGKNRVQYNDFYWQYYRLDKFDTYFNQYGKNLALYTQWYANKEITRIEYLMDYSLEHRIIFLIYNKLTDFRQSNIGLVNGNDDYNTGGMTRIVNNKVFLYFEGDHKKFQQQITQSIAQVTLNEMLYGSELRENVANSTLINLPDWYTQGLLSYLSENWSVEKNNIPLFQHSIAPASFISLRSRAELRGRRCSCRVRRHRFHCCVGPSAVPGGLWRRPIRSISARGRTVRTCQLRGVPSRRTARVPLLVRC